MCKLYDTDGAKADIAAGLLVEPTFEMCPDCGGKIHLNDWPVCKGKYGGHEPQGRYRPFIPFFDPHIQKGGAYIDSLATWNRKMKENGWELANSKHDRERPHPATNIHSAESNLRFNRAFNRAAQEIAGGIEDLSGLRDDD